jgi:phosphoribosyl-ATP pyrophosphohydrolase/phosphoribosyl-AMP cyclohydrolase
MLAYMNREAWERTIESGRACFWSRSRGALWTKGETSGHYLHVKEVRLDCDRDAVLLRVDPVGPTCHTGAPSCFFQPQDDGGPPGSVMSALDRELHARKVGDPGKSYTRSLLDAGMPKILAKIAEEAGELAAELPGGARERVIAETADLVYHVMVGLCAREVGADEVLRELARRFGTSGLAEKAARKK